MFLLGKILGSLFLPPGSIIALMVVAVALAAAGKKRLSIAAGLVASTSLAVFSFGPFSDLLITPLETRYPPLSGQPQATAVVVLGGGSLESSPEYGGKAALSPETLARATYGAELARRLDLPIIFSSGDPGHVAEGGVEAEAARRYWLWVGIDPSRIRLETSSRDTRENAVLTGRLFGKGPFIIVTSAYHMPRAMLSFRKAGISVVAAPTAYRRDGATRPFLGLLPSPGSLETSERALHEYLGLLWYFVRP